MASDFVSARALDSGDIRERNSANFFAIDLPFLSKLLQMFVVKSICDRYMNFIPEVLTGFVTTDQQNCISQWIKGI
jgi:hypothetical protein